jgi:hypothetical protein
MSCLLANFIGLDSGYENMSTYKIFRIKIFNQGADAR